MSVSAVHQGFRGEAMFRLSYRREMELHQTVRHLFDDIIRLV